MLDKLSRTDRRQEVRRPMRYALLEQHAWPALLTAAAVLGLEWLIRKRLGLPYPLNRSGGVQSFLRNPPRSNPSRASDFTAAARSGG